jgi:hypothetical protein
MLIEDDREKPREDDDGRENGFTKMAEQHEQQQAK